jgi:hypothetical protein
MRPIKVMRSLFPGSVTWLIRHLAYLSPGLLAAFSNRLRAPAGLSPMNSGGEPSRSLASIEVNSPEGELTAVLL